MLNFVLVLSGGEEGFCDSYLVRNFTLPSLPRLGEHINLGGDSYEIDSIWHRLEDGVAEIRISGLLPHQLYDAFLRYNENWKFEGFTKYEREKFRQGLKKWKQQNEKDN